MGLAGYPRFGLSVLKRPRSKADNARHLFRGFGKFALAGGSSSLAVMPAPAAPAGAIQVDVKLVIATDMSRSIDAEEAQIQRQGVADVFLDPAVISTIEKGSLGVIAVAMLDWSGYRDDRVVLDGP